MYPNASHLEPYLDEVQSNRVDQMWCKTSISNGLVMVLLTGTYLQRVGS